VSADDDLALRRGSAAHVLVSAELLVGDSSIALDENTERHLLRVLRLRDGEDISVIRLDELGPDKADMLTLVLIGNEQTRLIERGVGRWVYTPRGYAKKMDAVAGGLA
jgi:precorrin-3B methylase